MKNHHLEVYKEIYQGEKMFFKICGGIASLILVICTGMFLYTLWMMA